MEYHINGTFAPDNYYVSAGPFDGPYDAKNIKTDMAASASYGFTVPDTCLTDHYFVAFRTATSLSDAQTRGALEVTTFYFASDSINDQNGTASFENGRYNVTWSRIADHHYKFVITEAHTVTMTVAEGAPTDNLWIVFYQNQMKDNTRYDYYSWQQYESGKTTYTLSQLPDQR